MFVGTFPCNMEDGATDTTILCITSPAIPYKEYPNLEISVSVAGVGTAIAAKKFSYLASQTPVLNTVYPSVSYGGQGTKLSLFGIPRINDLGADKDQGNSTYIQATSTKLKLVKIASVRGLDSSNPISSTKIGITLSAVINPPSRKPENTLLINIFILEIQLDTSFLTRPP
jgi:hypothetical protein